MSDLKTILGNAFLKQRSDMLVAIGVLLGIVMFIVPLPAFLLDTFIALNLVMSLLVVLIVLYTQRALDFSIFPALLLVTTIFGLALNISSTRLILSQGSQFDGRLVRAFGTFVVGTGGLEGPVIG
ncbi:MAG: FHIPEP family type III secretion protein, partial [Spirochaetota bacterium]